MNRRTCKCGELMDIELPAQEWVCSVCGRRQEAYEEEYGPEVVDRDEL